MTQKIGLTYQGQARTCGLRLSVSDVVVLLLGIAAGGMGWFYIREIALIVPFVVIHFFLFCNVFRVRRLPELVWAVSFILNCITWNALAELRLEWIFSSQVLVMVILILFELKHPHYHGIFAHRINPYVDTYLESRR